MLALLLTLAALGQSQIPPARSTPASSEVDPALPVWTFDATRINPERNLRLYQISRRVADQLFDPKANLLFGSYTDPGEVKPGSPVIPNNARHMIRESAYYAYGLLLTSNPADHARAEEILKRILAAQDVRPDSPYRGDFTVFAEDRWEKLEKPDLNWAVFVGVVLGEVVALDNQRHVLAPDLRSQVESGLRLAVEAVMHRNVEPGYTNIAILSAALGSAGAKLLGMPEAGVFAQTKLDAVVGLTKGGLFCEYLSPTYTGVDLYAAYMAQKLSFAPAFSASANALLDQAWEETATSFHAPTLQLSGPNSRSYGDDMRAYAACVKYFIYLARPDSYPIAETETQHAWNLIGNIEVADLSVTPRAEFAEPVPAWRELSAVNPGKPRRHLFQYREDGFILGTIAVQDEWIQRRNLVAYWRNDGEGLDGFRLGLCLDKSNETVPAGFSPKEVTFYSKQDRGKALVAMVAPEHLPSAGGCRVVFSSSATAAEAAGSVLVRDGIITTYLYPISNQGAHFQVMPGADFLRLERPWTEADIIGAQHILAYLVIFRPANEPAPTISHVSLKPEGTGASVTAEIDGAPFTLVFGN